MVEYTCVYNMRRNIASPYFIIINSLRVENIVKSMTISTIHIINLSYVNK